MKKNRLNYLLGLLCMTTLLVGCNENDFEGPSPSTATSRYSNKLAPTAGSKPLSLTYSESQLYGKDLYVKMHNESSADITLFDVFMGEKQTLIKGVSLEEKGDKYVFSGNAVSEKGATFSYQGTISKDLLSFSILESKVPGNEFTAWPVHYMVPQFGRQTESLGGLPVRRNCWDYHSTQLICNFDSQANALSPVLVSLLEEPLQRLVASVLKEVRLEPDGNVLIRYASLPEGADLVNDFILGDANYMDREEGEWKLSPLNMVRWSISKEDSVVYVKPDIETMIRTLQAGGAQRAEINIIDQIELILSLLDLYSQVNTWMDKGIKLHLRKVPDPYVENNIVVINNVTQMGDAVLTLEKDELEKIFDILPLLKGFLPESLLAMVIPVDELPALVQLLFPQGIKVGEMIDGLIDDLAYHNEEFSFGLYLAKEVLVLE